MCGIAAIVAERDDDALTPIDTLVDVLEHRGPDDRGVEVLARDGVALGMRRLSILDLDGGRQPMWNEARTCCVVFNGEIYNARVLREQLLGAGHRFATSHSDTEVLVHGFEEWGAGLFERLDGMFAVAIWDRSRQRLVVARDRVGEKPLFIARMPSGFAVASELKSLLAHPDLSRELDPLGVRDYLAFDYTRAPRTVFEAVTKLPAAHYAILDGRSLETHRYWTPSFDRAWESEQEALDELDRLLDESVAERMAADVPLGLFLSGGVDSTTIGYYMRRHASSVASFSIGFEEPEYDESAWAAMAAAAIGTDHHADVLSQRRVLELIPEIPSILDEPMADSSVLPTYLLSLLTRRRVKVALGGDGSDELLMGYRAFQALSAGWYVDRLPRPLRRALVRAADATPTHIYSRPVRGVQFARRLRAPASERVQRHFGQFNGNPNGVLARDFAAPAAFTDDVGTLARSLNARTPQDEAVAAYLTWYLPEDILTKVDRASMAASLEVRSPFLDPALVEFALAAPPSLRLNRFRRKHLLRKLMHDRLPAELLDRPKRGFAVPLDAWLRGALAPLVRDLLSPERIRRAGIFDERTVTSLVDGHLNGSADHGRQLWVLLNFELWRDRWLR